MRFFSLLLGFSLVSGVTMAQIVNPVPLPRVVNLPVVGLASSETAQVNVVNLTPVPSITTAPIPMESCAGSISFYDAGGNLITTSTPAAFTIGAGQIFSVTVPYSAIEPADRPTTGNGRAAIRAVVSFPNNSDVSGACLIATNLETFDTATGVTHVHVEGSTGIAALLGLRLAETR